MSRRGARDDGGDQQLSLPFPVAEDEAAAEPAPRPLPSRSPAGPQPGGPASRPQAAPSLAPAAAPPLAAEPPPGIALCPPVPVLPLAAPAAPAPSARPHPLQRLLRHPRSNRESRLGGQLVGYELRRARRRTIGFVVADDGLAVSAPRWVPLAEIESALQEKSSWILRKLQEQGERLQRMEARRIEWRDGTGVPFLGETVIVVLDPRIAGTRLNTAAAGPGSQGSLAGMPRLTLHVGLPHSAAPEQIRDAVQSWLQRQARRVFEERCRHFAPQLGVQVKRLSLSSAQTRWGSASADGAIRLNWRLIHYAVSTIDYVVAHELAHLRVMDHSPRFWDVVRSVVPDYEHARGLLREDVLPVMD
jgi:predicted metal-dependent hydrolase